MPDEEGNASSTIIGEMGCGRGMAEFKDLKPTGLLLPSWVLWPSTIIQLMQWDPMQLGDFLKYSQIGKIAFAGVDCEI